jgi:glutamate racemase
VYPCAHLADYIEQNIFSLPRSLPQNLLPDIKVDSVVLGCTHYIFAKDIIQEYYRCPIFDGIVGTADHLKLILGNDDHFCESKGKITFKRGDFDKNRRVYELLTNTFKN